MKKTIAASAAIVAIGILITGCAQLEGAGQRSNKTIEFPVSVSRLTTDELLDEAARVIYAGIGVEIMQGLADADDLGSALDRIEEARQALQQLDEKEQAANVVIGNRIMAGLAEGVELGAALQRVEEERRAVMVSAGLAAPQP